MLTDPDKRCSCGGGCATFGACVRKRGIRIGQVDASEQKAWDAELNAFRAANDQGIRPAGTSMAKIREAVEISNKTGVAYGAN